MYLNLEFLWQFKFKLLQPKKAYSYEVYYKFHTSNRLLFGTVGLYKVRFYVSNNSSNQSRTRISV